MAAPPEILALLLRQASRRYKNTKRRAALQHAPQASFPFTMASDSAALTKFNNAVASTTSGANDVNDFVFQYWYKTNWGDLLQPAPMAVAILGNLTVVAAATDFKLVPPTNGTFKYVLYQDSFRATINQLVDTGAVSLEKSYANFDEIQKRCAGVKPGVNNIINLLSGALAGSEEEMNNDIKRYLPSQISQLQSSIQLCLSKAQETDTMFQDLLNLTMEINESCSATKGSYDITVRDAEVKKQVLAAQQASAQKQQEIAQEDKKAAQEAYQKAQDMFNKAADDMPKAWDLIGMDIVESLSHSLLSGVNAGINKYVAQSQQTTATQNTAISTAGGVPSQQGRPVIPSDVNDPAYQQGGPLRSLATALENIVTTGPNRGVNWDEARSTGAGDKNGLSFVYASLSLMQEGIKSSSQPSTTLKDIVSRGVQFSESLSSIAQSPNQDPDAVQKVVTGIQKFYDDALQFSITAANVTGTPPLQNPGFATASQPTGSDGSGSVMEMATKNAQFKLEATQQQLDAARKMSTDSTSKLLAVTQQLGDILGQIAGLNTQVIDWNKIRDVLLRAIAFLAQLKGCLSDMVHFFDSINNLVGVTLSSAAGDFIKLINDATKPDGGAGAKSIAGISLSNWTRQTIYNQALSAAKVARLVEDIAQIYLKMYDGHVQAGVKKLLGLGQFSAGDANQAALQKAAADIQTWADGASQGIQDLIKAEQDKMESDVQTRLDEMSQALAGILPPPSSSIKGDRGRDAGPRGGG
ncbi:hypothetical protein EXIGLDRAFT_836796 [Exidia glandulosa HHB12029]|uniref:Uncharacterized protein n=1 Tax=Exidia glandulosa HHB12029 TaxID=1314781 RepID=A0A165HFJ8_EXIGL|nr:hypothetical protein EXIGLDRAFT_836796 [Exidia glandulosa HHB12029]